MSADVLTFRDVMEANTADTIDKTATQIAAAIGLTKLQRAVLHNLVRDRVRQMWRNEVRPEEPRFGPSDVVDPAGDRAAYLSRRFARGDGRYVLWGEATVADHEQRIVMLSKLRDGLERTIAAHTDAVERILAAGVKCLNDLELMAAAS